MKPTHQPIDSLLAEIAAKHLRIPTLVEQKSGGDFHEVAVWGVEAALRAAFEAGRAAR